MATNICTICQRPFTPRRPCQIKTARFCSRRCGGKWHTRTRLNTGSKPYMRGNQFRKGIPPTNPLTSERAKAIHTKGETLPLVCHFCGNPFEVRAWVARQPSNTNKFCSVQCRSRFRSVFLSGPNAPDWKDGKTTYRGSDWPAARIQVIVKQRGFCAHCGVFRGKRLPVHHIKPFREFATSKEANQRSNLIGLCQRCHMRMEYAQSGASANQREAMLK